MFLFFDMCLISTVGFKKPLAKLMAEINGNMCEQVFSRFRHDAPTGNEIKELRHKFMLFYYVNSHKEALLHGQASYLRTASFSPSRGSRRSSPRHIGVLRKAS